MNAIEVLNRLDYMQVEEYAIQETRCDIAFIVDKFILGPKTSKVGPVYRLDEYDCLAKMKLEIASTHRNSRWNFDELAERYKIAEHYFSSNRLFDIEMLRSYALPQRSVYEEKDFLTSRGCVACVNNFEVTDYHTNRNQYYGCDLKQTTFNLSRKVVWLKKHSNVNFNEDRLWGYHHCMSFGCMHYHVFEHNNNVPITPVNYISTEFDYAVFAPLSKMLISFRKSEGIITRKTPFEWFHPLKETYKNFRLLTKYLLALLNFILYYLEVPNYEPDIESMLKWCDENMEALMPFREEHFNGRFVIPLRTAKKMTIGNNASTVGFTFPSDIIIVND